MSKINNKVTRDSKKLTNNKQRELSTERNVQKLSKPSETVNSLPNNSKIRQSTKVKPPTSSKIDTGNRTIIKQEKNHLPSTSRISLAMNKKTAPTTTKLSPTTNKLPSTNFKSSDKMKKSTPSTPPSSRILKTQYFPSKNMYANVIKEHIKIKAENKPQENDDRPKTATLRKGSIVNSNIIGPDAPRSETSSSISIETEDNDYEDDFESYESDFEEYQSSSPTSSINSELLEENNSTSSESVRTTPKQTSLVGLEEERMLDSGNYDMPENKYKVSLTNIKELTEKETKTSNSSNMASLSDEGFEDGKSLLHSNVPCINFAQAQKRIKKNRHLERQRKRGEEILNMIKLDNCNFTLFEMIPVSYDVFIKSFGSTNSIQVAIQTGEDNIPEETQTDCVETTTKWTQFPTAFSKIDCSNPNYLEMYKEEYAGVGNEFLKEKCTDTIPKNVTDKNSLLISCQLMLNLLYESRSSLSENFERNSREIPFSIGFINFNTQTILFLKDKPITLVSYVSVNKILTVHRVKKDCDDFFCKSVICVWNVLNSEEPEKILNVPGVLSCCCCFESNNLIVGGLVDGSLVMWHLGNSNKSFNNKHDENTILEQPIYITEINTAHLAKVISIKQLVIKNVNTLFNNNSSNSQLCSLDETGVLIIWVIIHKVPAHGDQNVLYWNQLSLVQNLKMCLSNLYPELCNILCTDMLVNFLDTYHIFISTNYECILHCLTNTSKARPKKYYSSISSQVNCLVSCPFSPQHFLAGHSNGAISIYSSLHERSLITLSNRNDNLETGVEFIQWSHNKPSSFYVKDYSNTIHVWDLKSSDLFPVYSVPFKQKITAMKLSVPSMKSNETSYMILTTDNGSIHLHILDSQDKQFNLSEYEHDVKNFMNYVNRL
ncbi:hypothetical protein RN001_006123 [Aquatica leii]|uniref:WD repeat-containing protein 60 n=1 Tax=Aquatica leii TaxID=1421715 RepID=A0AAN7PD88_9COLE|nr:hypothetical protein RN001_006123 [Aquatica leii]